MAHAEFRQRIDQGVGHGRHGADATGFAGAFDAERIGLGRYWVTLDCHGAEVVRMRHGVVHERAGDELAGGVEMDVFHQNLTGALRDAAMDLAMQQQRIEHGADVVDHAVAHDLDLAGVLLDLELADVATVRIIRGAL